MSNKKPIHKKVMNYFDFCVQHSNQIEEPLEKIGRQVGVSPIDLIKIRKKNPYNFIPKNK
jgi:hypothetical protein|tara:strand:+ start:4412 stop:4591 length:180 start_codon:yes stop_codon:yes gene_type:complete